MKTGGAHDPPPPLQGSGLQESLKQDKPESHSHPASTAWGQFQYMKKCFAQAPGFHDVWYNRNNLAWKIFKAGVASHPP